MMQAHTLDQAGSTRKAIAEAIGVKSQSTVTRYIRLAEDYLKKQRSVRTQALPTDKRGNPTI